MFKKILIANRGEIALRIIRTCKEMGIKTVAVYSTADRDSLHVRFADEAVCIGPPPSRDSYLNIPNIISAAELTNADAIHPGYGFLSENAKFSAICAEYGIKFIGATAAQINSMGDKASAKETMKKAGVPIVPGSEGLLQSVKEGISIAKKIGYPVILKATAGGGGRGMRIVWKDAEFEAPGIQPVAESGAALVTMACTWKNMFRRPAPYRNTGSRRSVWQSMPFSERDCSIQRRHQKLVEESPSPFMTEKLRKKMGEAAIKGAKAVKYEGAGTVEFLVDKDRNFYFMEMNTRIQVEHPVTEEVINFDLIKEQIKLLQASRYQAKITSRRCMPSNAVSMPKIL
jgi:acetyl-CoA carboxylase biotin carboxylase subunit